jgi:hypothetical protein
MVYLKIDYLFYCVDISTNKNIHNTKKNHLRQKTGEPLLTNMRCPVRMLNALKTRVCSLITSKDWREKL